MREPCIHRGRVRARRSNQDGSEIEIRNCDLQSLLCVDSLQILGQMPGSKAVACDVCPHFAPPGDVSAADLPLVSCLMATYNFPERQQAVEEVVEAFLKQDYPRRELIILIDSPGQRICFNHPLVKVVNVESRFPTLGEKLNAAAAVATGEFLCRWDDDDISLPHRISSQVAALTHAGADYYTPGSIWCLDGDTIEWQPQRGYGHSQGMMRRFAFEASGGYAATSGDEDAELHTRLRAACKHVSGAETAENAAFIYRWGDGLNHISAHGTRMGRIYEMNGEIGEPGSYSLRPHWRRDYVSLTRGAAQSVKRITLPRIHEHIKLCVVGFPSRYGGADTELDHQISVWRAMGVDVHLIPTGPLDDGQRSLGVAERGCTIHQPQQWSACRGMHVISYCNGEFLKALPKIKPLARSTTFVNCMTWLFEEERRAHAAGLIDWFLYQSDHAREKVEPHLRAINARYQWAKVRPYFDAAAFPFSENRHDDEFFMCRVSRDDPAKFSADTMRILDLVKSPVSKRGVILGISPKVYEKTGPAPAFVECLAPGEEPAAKVYHQSHVLLQACDTYENLPRVGMEAMASGCVPIVDRRGGWLEVVEDGTTGVLCDSTFDFVMAASQMAQNPEWRRQMAIAGRQRVIEQWGLESAAREWSAFFQKLEETAPALQQPPTLLIRGWNFTKAMARWTAAGMPMRSQSEIDERLAICQACPHLQADHCSLCGCACVETNQVMNKLALATEKCPMRKWS